MKLLFDHNLSFRLVSHFSAYYPDSAHVRDVGLSESSDEDVWQFARNQGYVIVTKDSDYEELGTLRSHPPKIIWIRRGNCSTREIAELIEDSRALIDNFEKDTEATILMLF